MARRAAGPPAGRVTRYTPVAYGNRRAPEADQVHVTIRYPSAQEKRQIATGHGSVRYAIGKDGQPAKDAAGNAIVEVDAGQIDSRNAAIVSRFVEKVENYLDARGKPILDGASLAEHGEDLIVSEVADEIWHGVSLTAAEGKGCAGSSDSSPAETRSSPLTATNAGATPGTVDATADVPTKYLDTESSYPEG